MNTNCVFYGPDRIVTMKWDKVSSKYYIHENLLHACNKANISSVSGNQFALLDQCTLKTNFSHWFGHYNVMRGSSLFGSGCDFVLDCFPNFWRYGIVLFFRLSIGRPNCVL